MHQDRRHPQRKEGRNTSKRHFVCKAADRRLPELRRHCGPNGEQRGHDASTRAFGSEGCQEHDQAT